MNHLVPPFKPPSRPHTAQGTDFRALQTFKRDMEEWLDRYTKYIFEYLTQVTTVMNTGAQGYPAEDITAAAEIFVVAYISRVQGSTTISTISTPPGFSGEIVLIADDGFATDTTGNISAAVAIAAGQAGQFNFDPVTALWYPTVGESALQTSSTTQWAEIFQHMGA